MNYEQKYKEALERAKEWMAGKYSHYVSDTPQEISEFIFPELKESMDEKIRKEIIKLVKFLYGSSLACEHTISKDKMLAWLEKQINDEDIHLLKLKAKAYDDAKERMSYAYNQNRVPIGFISEIFPNLNSYEKQSEQKPADKVEPKFKVGDWIVNEFHDICLITDIDLENSYYICESNRFGNTEGDIDLTDKEFHLWSIEDVKDGDIISYDNGWTCIFKHIHGIWYSSYCFVTADGEFNLGYEEHAVDSTINGNVKPATKEQRDLLFAKMKEAGYEWNANKKELIKL